MYDEISAAWAAEVNNEGLQNLEDLKLSKMVKYLSEVRFALTETSAENQLQADLLTEEALNLEFMLKDFLMLRRTKIVKAALTQKRPSGGMVLPEEELYNRLLRGIEGHLDFIKESLTGMPSSTLKRPRAADPGVSKTSEDLEYVLVKFLRPIEEAFLGMDEAPYGPFKKEDIATIPAANARLWLQDGTVTRVVPNNEGR